MAIKQRHHLKPKTNGKPPQLHEYRAYKFNRGRDPVIDQVLPHLPSPAEVQKGGGANAGTVRNWRHKTRRPQHCSMAASLAVVGKKFVIVDI
jgi:hypothetical protein